jgi:aminoglycoside phosphotransferase (APT) family kinase protein
METPAAEVEVDKDLVRSLLMSQHPDLAELPLSYFKAGWDNVLWRLGDDLQVRLPRRYAAAWLTLHEQRWLPQLAPLLPLPVPSPVRIGSPAAEYPWAWSVVPWLDGEPGDAVVTVDAAPTAASLGRFLAILHQPAPPEAPRNPARGGRLSERDAAVRERLEALSATVDVAAVTQVWTAGLRTPPWKGHPVWLHGDLHPANVLFTDGCLSAVIDFGDMCAGDPATDIAAAWMLLPGCAMQHFVASYGGIDDDTCTRARAWAVMFGTMLLAIGLDRSQPRTSYAAVGLRTLKRLLLW